MAKLPINLSGSAGLVDLYAGDLRFGQSTPNLRNRGKDGQYATGVVNPLRVYGYVSPGNNSVTAISDAGLTTLTRAIKVDEANAKIYYFDLLGSGSKIHKIDGLDSTSGTVIRTITGATATDLEIYTVNGTRKLFYSYAKSGGGNIGVFDLTSTYDDTWLSGTATGGFNTGATTQTRMVIADNGFMYVLDGNAVHKVDGTTDGGASGTVTANVLLFPSFFTLVDATDFRGLMWIGVIQSPIDPFATSLSSPAGVGIYVWDRQSTRVSMTDFIYIPGVMGIKAVFSYENTCYCFAISNSKFTQIRAYDGKNFTVVKQLGYNAYPRYPKSVVQLSNGFMWLGVDGIMYFYGRPIPSADNGLFQIGDISANIAGGTTFSQTGAITAVSTNLSSTAGEASIQDMIILTYTDTGVNAYIKQYLPYVAYANSAVVTGNTGLMKTLVYQLPKLSTVDFITLYFPPLSSGGATSSLAVDVYLNQSTTSTATTTLTLDDGTRGYHVIPVGKTNVNFIQIGFTWVATGLTSAIMLSSADIEYTPTTKLK